MPRRVGRAGAEAGRPLAHAAPPSPPGPAAGLRRLPGALLDPRRRPARPWPWWCPPPAAEIRLGPGGYDCTFGWQGATHQYPLVDAFLLQTLTRLERRHMGAHDLARVLGYRPGRILVVLSEPHDGYCWKEVAALLPGT